MVCATTAVAVSLSISVPANAEAPGPFGSLGSTGSTGSLGSAACSSSAAPRDPLGMSMLDTADQRAVETAARALVDLPAVVDAERTLIEKLRQTPSHADPATAADLEGYAAGLAWSQATKVARELDPLPRAVWGQQPNGRYGLDNPDNVYRTISVDGTGSFVVTGRRNSSFDVYFQLMDAGAGDGTLGNTLGFLSGDRLLTEPDGSFTITLSPEPATGTGNHIQLLPGAKHLVVRDTLSDWGSQNPTTLSVSRTAGTFTPPSYDPEQEVARLVAAHGDFWNAYVEGLGAIPVGGLQPPRPSQGGLPGQVSAFGRFAPRDDEATVITVDRADAGYLGLQLGNYWFTSLNYWDHNSSFNGAQSVPDADGKVTFVLSKRDPGVCNWIDPVDHGAVLLFLRWQNLPDDRTPARPVVTTVPFAQLDSSLDPAVARATPADRIQQLIERRISFDRRGASLP